jgi:hypothetical protein
MAHVHAGPSCAAYPEQEARNRRRPSRLPRHADDAILGVEPLRAGLRVSRDRPAASRPQIPDASHADRMSRRAPSGRAPVSDTANRDLAPARQQTRGEAHLDSEIWAARSLPCCPVCATEPDAIEDRDTAALPLVTLDRLDRGQRRLDRASPLATSG